MLNILKNLSSEAAEYLLATVIKSLLPSPKVQPSISEGPVQAELQMKVLEEVKRKLRLDANDQSHTANAKILEFLASEVCEYILSRANVNHIKNRLGQRGELWPSHYEVEFSRQFADTAEKRGVRRKHVVEALRQPDAVEHLLTPRIKDSDSVHFSLYIKVVKKPETTDPFNLLVQTRRTGNVQSVASVWRIYLKDVNLKNVREPLDVLRAFVEVYGMDFRIAESSWGKFFLYESIQPGVNQRTTKILEVENLKNENWESGMLFRKSSLGVIEIAVAYVINISKYTNDLRRHGVEITE